MVYVSRPTKDVLVGLFERCGMENLVNATSYRDKYSDLEHIDRLLRATSVKNATLSEHSSKTKTS